MTVGRHVSHAVNWHRFAVGMIATCHAGTVTFIPSTDGCKQSYICTHHSFKSRGDSIPGGPQVSATVLATLWNSTCAEDSIPSPSARNFFLASTPFPLASFCPGARIDQSARQCQTNVMNCVWPASRVVRIWEMHGMGSGVPTGGIM